MNAPTRAEDAAFKGHMLRNLRLGASPSAAQAITRMAQEIDIRDVLPAIRVPTLVLTTSLTREESRFVADRIPDARVFEVSGPDIMIALLGDDVYDEIERFVCGLDAPSRISSRAPPSSSRTAGRTSSRACPASGGSTP